MTLNEIERALRDLRLSGIAATLNTRVMQAQSAQQPFLETLAVMLQDELDRTKSALEERKVIDRAKGILMKLKGLTEEEAYVLMRSTAMREKKKIGEIAQSILTASELLK